MFAIIKNDIKSNMISFKYLLTLALLILISVITANKVKHSQELISQANSTSIYVITIEYILMLIGYLILAILSYDVINKYIITRDIRFIVTRITRDKIIIGQMIALNIFLLSVFIVPMLLISLYSNQFLWKDYLVVILFCLYSSSVIFFISVNIYQPKKSLLLNFLVSVLIPFAGIYGAVHNNVLSNMLKYLIPFSIILEKQTGPIISLVFITIFINITSVIIFIRKDL